MVFFRCIVLILVYLPFTLSSQSLGSVTGKVIDRYQQYPLEFVNVQVDGTAKGGATDSLGYFLIDNIPVGTYNLLFSSLGTKHLHSLMWSSPAVIKVTFRSNWRRKPIHSLRLL